MIVRIMSIKKKKNIILLSLSMVTCFILYQVYFFLAITKENDNGSKIVPVFYYDNAREASHVRSEADKFINTHGAVKGVLNKLMVKYRPDSRGNFKCLNSEQSIPFEAVNDDYCDCDDGTDEPSTNACPNGVFYCDSQYQKKSVLLLQVPSSRVNDGICDCCDGSDEWLIDPNKKLLSQAYDNFYRFLVPICSNVCSA